MRYIVLALLVGIFISLGSGLVYLIKDQGNSDRTAKALTWRIGLSLAMFALIIVAYRLGWVSGRLLG